MNSEKVEEVKKSKIGSLFNRYFHFYERGGDMKSEIYAGISMFLVSIFIILFNMQMVHDQFYANEMYPTVYFGLYFGATIVSFFATIAIGLIGRLPLVQVSGLLMSSSILSLVGNYAGLTYPNVMAISLISSIFSTIIFAVPLLRKQIVEILPVGVKKALPVLVGLMLALFCLKNGHFIQSNQQFYTFELSNYLKTDMYGGIFIITLIVMVITYLFVARKSKSHPMFVTLWIGLAAYFVLTACYGLLNLSNLQLRGFLLVVTDDHSFGLMEGAKALGQLLKGNESQTIPSLIQSMWDFSGVKANGGSVVGLFIEGILTFLSIGVFANYAVTKDIEEEVESNDEAAPQTRSEMALLTCSITNLITPFLGVMPTTISMESTVGKKDHAKTALSSIVASVGFFISLFAMLGYALFATDLGSSAYGHANEYQATISGVSSYLIYIVGLIASISLVAKIRKCDFQNKMEFYPLLITILVGFFTMNFVYGIGSGCLLALWMNLFMSKEKKKFTTATIGSGVIGLCSLIVFIISLV